MRARLPLLLAGVSTAAALSAGLVLAQTVTMPQDTPPPGAAPAPAAPSPAAVLPPQESAPPAPPFAADDKAKDKSSSPAADDGVEAKDDSPADNAEAKADTAAPDPAKRQVYSAAVVQALDKITAETMRFEVTAGRPVRWKGLVFTLKTCETSAPDESVKDAMAFMQVRSEPHAQSEEASREIFRGWMSAIAPALNPLQHPVYDAWLIACKA
jgi:hypothetical protein